MVFVYLMHDTILI